MLAPHDLNRLLDECVTINSRLSSGARRTLRHFLRLRERHGSRTAHYMSADDIELLEDWAATACRVRIQSDTRRQTLPSAPTARAVNAAHRDCPAHPRPAQHTDGKKTETTAHVA